MNDSAGSARVERERVLLATTLGATAASRPIAHSGDVLVSFAEQAGASPEVVESTYRALVGAFIALELDRHRAR